MTRIKLDGAVFRATVNGTRIDLRQLKGETSVEFLRRLREAIDAVKEE